MRVNDAAKWTHNSIHTVSDWYNLCHNVSIDAYDKREKIEGVGEEVQIYKSIFQGKCKNNRGQFLASDNLL